MPRVLGIESTCDETGVALVEGGRRVVANAVASQVELHALYGGVVPEIASRRHIDNLLPTFESAGVDLSAVDAVAVAHRPGLIGCLVVGVTAAKALAWTLGVPLVAVDHVRAHLYSVLLDNDLRPPLPAVGLVVSGGHTSLYRVASWHDVEPIGRTIDDAVGEAYDKVAAMLGLGYPGGPTVDKLAASGDPTAYDLPRPTLGKDSLDFSFSGLKTAVLYRVLGQNDVRREPGDLSDQEKANACASFQAACVDVLGTKVRRAVRQIGAKSVVIGGGVSANRGLRAALGDLPVPAFSPPMAYCTDNAAMIAGLGHVLLEEDDVADLSLDPATAALA